MLGKRARFSEPVQTLLKQGITANKPLSRLSRPTLVITSPLLRPCSLHWCHPPSSLCPRLSTQCAAVRNQDTFILPLGSLWDAPGSSSMRVAAYEHRNFHSAGHPEPTDTLRSCSMQCAVWPHISGQRFPRQPMLMPQLIRELYTVCPDQKAGTSNTSCMTYRYPWR